MLVACIHAMVFFATQYSSSVLYRFNTVPRNRSFQIKASYNELIPYCMIAFLDSTLKCLLLAKILEPKLASRCTIIVLKPYCMDLTNFLSEVKGYKSL
jgi:hypothetical protein